MKFNRAELDTVHITVFDVTPAGFPFVDFQTVSTTHVQHPQEAHDGCAVREIRHIQKPLAQLDTYAVVSGREKYTVTNFVIVFGGNGRCQERDMVDVVRILFYRVVILKGHNALQKVSMRL